jgi:hypothetical protein
VGRLLSNKLRKSWLGVSVHWATERELLDEMVGWTPLPDDHADPRWDVEGDAWEDAGRLIAAADASGDHTWRVAAVKVFEHAAVWDLNGMMQSIRHGPERAFSDDEVGEQEFAALLEPLTTHDRAGTRRWVVRELGLLRQLSSLPFLVARLEDQHPDVAEEALLSIQMLGRVHPAARRAAPPFVDD